MVHLGRNPITAQQFANVLHKVPQIGSNVRILVYYILPADFDIPNIGNALKSLERLRNLDLTYAPKPSLEGPSLLDWTTCPLQREMVYLLGLPNLRALKLRRIINVSLTDLYQSTKLEELAITTDLVSSPEPSTFQSSAFDLRVFSFLGEGVAGAKRLLQASRDDGTPAFGIKNMRMMDAFLSNLNKAEVISIFYHAFQRAKEITSIRLAISCDFEGLCDQILPLKAFETLTVLDLNFFYNRDLLTTENPWGQLSEELTKLVDINQLRKIRVGFVMPSPILSTWLENNRADWSTFDEVLTRKGWPHLQRVTVAIWIRLSMNEPPEVATTHRDAVKVYLDGMRASGLRCLATSKTVKLVLTSAAAY